MLDFKYTARNKDSKSLIEGTIQADSEAAAGALLIEKGLVPVRITKFNKNGILNIAVGGKSKVKAKDRVLFTRQLATVVKAGLPITQALATTSQQVSSKNFKAILEKIIASVEGGASLSGSFAQYPEVFSHTYISIIKAGEASGTLDVALGRLAKQEEKEAQIASKIRGAMIYPAIVLVVILIVVGFMLVSVLPQVGDLYKSLGKELPVYTKALLSMSSFIKSYWWLVLITFAAMVLGIRSYKKTKTGRKIIDKSKISMPIIGGLMMKVYMARLTRTLGSLVSSGVPVLEALDIASKSINNVIIEAIVDGAAQQVKGGKNLSNALTGHKYILALVPQMMKIGEDSGTLGDMLDKVASLYEDEVDQTVSNFSTIIEPVFMIVLGGIVFFIIAAVLLPIYSLVGGGVDTTTSPTVTQPK